MPPMLWQARTVKHVLIDRHGMDAAENPIVQCACGRRAHADVCVDITALPIGVRKALGLHLVDYLCDGCQTRLFRELHIGEEEFYSLLGAPEEAKVFHRERDIQHQTGCDLRPEYFRPKYPKVSQADMVGKKLGEIPELSRIPMSRSRRSVADAARRIPVLNENPIVFSELVQAEPTVDTSQVIDLQPTDGTDQMLDVVLVDPNDLPADAPLPDGVVL